MPDVKARIASALGPQLVSAYRQRRGRHRPWDQAFTYKAGPTPGRLPDFVGVGVQKAGTSWWFAMVSRHPSVDVKGLVHKELHFFSKSWSASRPPDMARYASQFQASPGTVTGEWTPDYLFQPWVAPLLAAHVPDARLLVLLRDPYARFVSGVSHDLQRGERAEPRLVDQAIARSLYGQQLSRFLPIVGRERVLVLQYESVREDVEGQLARTHDFLGLEAVSLKGADGQSRVNATSGPKFEPPLDVAAMVRRRLAEDRLLLETLGLDLELDRWAA